MALFCYFQISDGIPDENISDIQEKHSEFLKKAAPKKDAGFTRLEKIQKGIPPNAYYELMNYLTMNPALGYPEPYKLKALQERLNLLRKKRNNYKAPGESENNRWVSRGPNNVGGRTRVLLFDPADPSGKRVFAGAISGGLWINDDITRETSPWKQVAGLPANLNVSCLTVDPRDPKIWYAGTGEQYTGGDVVGTGVYKSVNGGLNWEKVLDVQQFSTGGSGQNALIVGGVYYINDIEAWDNGTSTEVFIGVSTHLYANAKNPGNYLGYLDKGLYGSKDGGATWNNYIEELSFNDFETDAAGNLWVATTYSPGESGSRGGRIYKREKGEDTDFRFVTTVPDVTRTEIEASSQDPQKFYVVAEGYTTEEAEMWITTNAFETLEPLNEPKDADNDISTSDFARDQAFYNLMIESDPSNDAIVYAGGINLFRSTDSGNTWKQISRWTDLNAGLDKLPVSIVHADHHVMKFRPGNSNQAVFGHDGGVSFARDLSSAAASKVFITPQENYITTQFYSVAVAPGSFATGDYFLGGTQDNGTQLHENSKRASVGILGGDGAHSFFDQVDTDYLVANLVYNDLIVLFDYSDREWKIIADNEDQDGFFINPQALDSNLDLLFSNGPEGKLYRYENLTSLKPGRIGEGIIADRKTLSNSLLNASISSLSVSPYTKESSTVLVGLTNGRLLKIEKAHGETGAAVWKNISGSQFLGSISDIEFGSSEAEIFVTFYNYGVKSIWYTSNGKDERPVWVNKEGDLPDLPVLSILPNPLNTQEVIVGTELGIWVCNNFRNDQPKWIQAYNGMSDVKVTDLDLKKGNNVVYAASYGRGIFSGQFTTSVIEEEETGSENDEVVVFPTISDQKFGILSLYEPGPAEVLVFDHRGRLVQMSKVELSLNLPVEIDLAKEASGIYFLKVESSSISHIQKIVKK